MAESWQITAEKKRRELAEQLHATGYPALQVDDDLLDVTALSLDDLLSPSQKEITELAPEVLVERIAKGVYTAVDVTEAFCRRAVIAHKLTNCINVIFFDKALARAKELDQHFTQTGKTVGPLHGLPISLKNQVNVGGVEMNMCYVGWVDRIAGENGVLADILIQQGAVLYLFTNLAQSLEGSDTVNNLYGRTSNPFNRRLSVGGSSGGEGALLALHGSPMGVGSDSGGSIRFPASFNGLYGFRGSWHRIPHQGSSNVQLGQEVLVSILGPLSPSAHGLKLFFKSVLAAQPWLLDPLAMRMPWDEKLYQLHVCAVEGVKRPLCFGFMWDNGEVKPNPPYFRAMNMVKVALERAGHTVIDWALPDTSGQAKLSDITWEANQGAYADEQYALSGEPRLGQPPDFAMSAAEYQTHIFACRESAAKVMRAWAGTKHMTGTSRPIDGLITPTAPYPSFLPDQEEYYEYTAVSNLNDFPTSTFPVTRVDPKLDTQLAPHEFRLPIDKDIYERYDPEVYKGVPIGLQLMGRRGEDEAVLGMTEMISELLGSVHA